MKSASLLLTAFAVSVAAWSEEWKERFGQHEQHIRGHYYTPGAESTDAVALAGVANNTKGNSTFKQLIDHNNPDLGSFDQFYYWSAEFWKGPGSPVIMFTPGEVNGSRYNSYLTLNRTTGLLAQQIGAAIFVMEHRYWGTSSPYTNLTTENMKYLTLDNSIKDLTYFAKNIVAPWAPDTSTVAKDVPWVMMGGSYSGALSAWTESVEPGVYWAYHSSSAPVQALSDYWGYFVPVQEGMAQNCSKDVSAVIDYMDNILTTGTKDQIDELKSKFQLQDLEHNDDFMGALENGPWLWQGNQFYTNYSAFFQWCDYIENTNTTTPSADGVGVEKALQGYADWFVEQFLPNFCYDTYGYEDFAGVNNTACFNTYNASSPLFTDSSLANTFNRQWQWMLCNEPFGYWQDGAPSDTPTLVSRLVDANYWIRQCPLFFPDGPNGETYGINKGRTEADTNKYTGGWEITNTTRLYYVNGEHDPWREVGVSAIARPGGPLESTSQVPVSIVPLGFHVSDMITRNGKFNAGVQQVINDVMAQLATWVGEWPKTKKVARSYVA